MWLLYWEYNGDVGRRWNVDPKPNRSISPYVAFADNGLFYQDLNGDIIKLSSESDRNNLLSNLNSEKAFGKGAFSFNDKNELQFVGNSKHFSKQQKKALNFLQGQINASYTINVKLSNFSQDEKDQFKKQSEQIIPGFPKENGSYSEISLSKKDGVIISDNVCIDASNITPVIKTQKLVQYFWKDKDGIIHQSENEPKKDELLNVAVGQIPIRQTQFNTVMKMVNGKNIVQTLENNLLSAFFHELGHAAEETKKNGQSKVNGDENLIRKVLDMEQRPDEDPSHTD